MDDCKSECWPPHDQPRFGSAFSDSTLKDFMPYRTRLFLDLKKVVVFMRMCAWQGSLYHSVVACWKRNSDDSKGTEVGIPKLAVRDGPATLLPSAEGSGVESTTKTFGHMQEYCLLRGARNGDLGYAGQRSWQSTWLDCLRLETRCPNC